MGRTSLAVAGGTIVAASTFFAIGANVGLFGSVPDEPPQLVMPLGGSEQRSAVAPAPSAASRGGEQPPARTVVTIVYIPVTGSESQPGTGSDTERAADPGLPGPLPPPATGAPSVEDPPTTATTSPSTTTTTSQTVATTPSSTTTTTAPSVEREDEPDGWEQHT